MDRLGRDGRCLLVLLSAQWVGAIGRQIRAEWPRRADRQAVLDAIPDGARVAAPMHALPHLAEREHLYVVPEPLLAVRVGTEWGDAERERATEQLDYIVFDPGMRFWGAPTVEQVEQEIERRGFVEVMRRGDTRLYGRERRVSHRVVALIGARSGSERVPGKNVRRLAGHPLLAYAIETARQSGVFERIVVSTDSEEIAKVARWYGADVPFLRPDEYATATSPDIEWIAWTLPRSRSATTSSRSCVRPTRSGGRTRSGAASSSCSRRPRPTRSARSSGSSSTRGRCGSSPIDGRTMLPLLDQSHLDVAWHAGQYQALPPVYVQNSALEIAWTRVVRATGTREGRVLAPFLTEGYEGLNIDDEDDFAFAERLVADGRATLPAVERDLIQVS